jgi:hypothetical protein
MGNATVVVVDFIVWRVRAQTKAGADDIRLEQTIDRVVEADTDNPDTNGSENTGGREAPAQREKTRRLGRRMVETIHSRNIQQQQNPIFRCYSSLKRTHELTQNLKLSQGDKAPQRLT